MRSVTLNFADWLEAIFWRSFWHIFWHSFWHIFWYIFWHSFWHICWHSFWHIFRSSFWHLSDISFDILSDISSDILSDISFDMLSNISSDILSDISKPKPNIHSFTKKPLCKLYIYLTPRSKSNIHDNFVPVNVIALSASDRPAKRQLSPKMQNACSSTRTHTDSHSSMSSAILRHAVTSLSVRSSYKQQNDNWKEREQWFLNK